MANNLALVTGASSGIGYSLAKELAGRGYDLVVCSAGNRLEGAAQDFQALGTNVTEVRADLATKEGVRELWSKAQQLGRPVDVACLNAGVGVGGLFWQTDLDAELNMVYLNCAGTVQLAKYVGEVCGAGDGEPRDGQDPVHCVDCGRDGGAARGSVRRQQCVRTLIRTQSSLRAA
jgi:short-subunit dehydrogenase